MNKSYKRFLIILFVIGTILIIIGLGLTLKELMDNEKLFNIADDSEYYKLTINLNGANSVENVLVKCKASDNNACDVILPIATKNDGIVLGYSDNKSDTIAKYKVGEVFSLNKNMELYVISYKTYKITIDKTGIDYLEKNEVLCNAYNEEKECSVIIPNFNKVGYENKGYSTSEESLVGFKFPGEEYKISKDIILYPIYSTSSRKINLNINNNFTYRDSFIEIEKGCDESVYSKYLKYLDDIDKHIPFILIGNKITFISDNSFDTIWGKKYVGMNYGPKSLRSVDIRCSSNTYNDYYATMVHEMAHSWDFYYANKLGDNISSQSDIINLYNKYKSKKNRPFRDYSYSSIYEFVADMVRYYYFKYDVPRSGFSDLNYPSDIKKVLEKYMCISKNDYDESKCVT